MKKILSVLSASALLLVGILFASCDGFVEGDTNFATTTIGTPSVTAKAYPGVNILTWKAIKDAGSYIIYRTVGDGNIEEPGVPITNAFYVDKAIDEGTQYKYRVVAVPADLTAHDASQTEVALTTAKAATGTNVKGTWAPEGTVFTDLAQYESDYNANATVLSDDTIAVKLVTATGSSVRVTFPTKAYANYAVYLSQVNGVLTNTNAALETFTTVAGYNYNGSATVTLDAVYSGKKQITVVATPLNNTLYGKSQIASSTTIEVKALSSISSAVTGDVSAKWTNYNTTTRNATARVYFSPYVYDGAEFTTDEYTIFRAVYTSGGETSTTLTNSDGTPLRIYDSITNIGSPKKDTTVDPNGATVYYLDDTVSLRAANDVAGVRYYVVLNHNGYIKTDSSSIIVPSDSDSDWNFTPDSVSSSDVVNSVRIADIYIGTDGIAYVGATVANSLSTVTGTYGTFDTLNEAKVAIESELPTSLTVSKESSSYDKLFTTGTATVNTNKYYAFRLLSTRNGATDVVATTIAKPYKVGGAYYWNIQTNKPSNYVETVGTASLTVDTELGTDNYISATLTYSASAATANKTVYYNIYRYVTSSSISTWSDSAELLKTTTDTQYVDTSISSRSVDRYYIYYKVSAVSYYDSTESSSVKASRLKTPVMTLRSDGKTLSWNIISAADGYRIYRAKTQAELEADDIDYAYDITSKSTTTYTNAQSYAFDYVYAVKAYANENGSYDYSNASSPVTVKKATLEAPAVSMDLYSYGSNSSYSDPTYTWILTWEEVDGYSDDYYILRYTSYDTSDTEESVKALFEKSPTSYYDYSRTTSNTYYNQVTASTSTYYSTWYAVATHVRDSISGTDVYSVSDVFKPENSIGNALEASGSYGTYTLSWPKMTYTTDDDTEAEVAAYAIYAVNNGDSSTLSATSTTSNLPDYIESLTPVETVTANDSESYTYTYTASSYRGQYHFFIVVGLDANGEDGKKVDSTNIVRVYN